MNKKLNAFGEVYQLSQVALLKKSCTREISELLSDKDMKLTTMIDIYRKICKTGLILSTVTSGPRQKSSSKSRFL